MLLHSKEFRFAHICWLIGAIIFSVFYFGSYIYNKVTASTQNVARIKSDSTVIDTIDLSKVDEPYEFEIRNELGYNKVRVEKGRIAVIEADCPDKVCVNQGYIEEGGLPIVCLPHKLTITMQSSNIDAVSGR